MRISIYQPRYFPQLHYFNRALSSDVFVILDSAQYTKALVHDTNGKKERHKSYQSDTVIKLPNGIHFLTVSAKHNGLQPISETGLDYSSDWARRHTAAIESTYKKAEKFEEIFPGLKELLKQEYKTLGELNVKTFLWGMACILGIKSDVNSLTVEKINEALQNSPFKLKRVVLGTQLGVSRPEGFQKGTEWTVDICKKLGANEYLHGGTAQAGYMNEDYYHKNNIKLITQNWKCAEYPQLFNKKLGFIPNLSIIDLLLNAGQKRAVEILSDQ